MAQRRDDETERVMKVLQYVASVMFVLAGIVLLCAPAHAAGFAPTRFTVVDQGTVGKPDVVLIPGLASSRAVWDGEAKLLAPNYRLHLVQIDGFAGAPAGANATGAILPDVVEQLHQYIAATGMHPVVIGHSLGGLLTLMLAAKYPADVRRMVIVDALPFYGSIFSPDATVASLKPQADAMMAQLAGMPDDQYAAMQPMMAAQLVRNADAQKLVAASGAASDRRVVTRAMLEDLATDMRPELASIQTPTLVLYAVDPVGNPAQAAQYAATVEASYKAMPHVTLVNVEGSRHFIMYDQPAKFDAAVEEFLK
jgi:pimeloyl-ACP methyl ester carboxylesterase